MKGGAPISSVLHVLEGELRASHGGLLLDGLDLAEEIGHLLDAERDEHGAMTKQEFGRIRIVIQRASEHERHAR